MENPKQKFVYGTCMRNHAAKLGGFATDGCIEFVPTDDGPHCVACRCHLSFHKKMAVVGNTGGGGGMGEGSNSIVKVNADVVEVSDDEAEKEEEKKLQALLQIS
ncbi:zinc-finger homeodomain protein 11-like [Telopea speciosissima]|uniref:zinc-finger homeodomain protein 11-like n=1 Tax=Telopea speciosissima TaxID=54955 RepID=UPI001CC5BE7C|nr:zinc-finger homeodomain protein 11-like [Telopea speciosissima]